MLEASATGVLEKIALHTQTRLRRWRKERPLEALRQAPLYRRVPGDFSAAFAGAQPRVIAEVKFASPSEGFLRPQAGAQGAVEVAGGYLRAGAAALSILTERHFFAGSPDFLSAVRERHPEARLLMKDFVVDGYQLELARSIGADCVLLIVALLGEAKAKALLQQADTLGLSVLVEVHTEEEMDCAQRLGAKLIGVNSRDLKTLKTDLGTARRLAGRRTAILIAESGLKTRADLDELSALGYKGFLVGTSLMKEDDPGAALRALLA